jgi:hypothetical protein
MPESPRQLLERAQAIIKAMPELKSNQRRLSAKKMQEIYGLHNQLILIITEFYNQLDDQEAWRQYVSK